MDMLYFDDILKGYEAAQDWESALSYLQTIYLTEEKVEVLNSLVGFSWFYFLDGMRYIRKDESAAYENYLMVWKKYLNEGFKNFNDIPSFNFIAGYTISLDGFFIYRDHEEKGLSLIKKCLKLSNNDILISVCDRFIENTKSDKSAKPYKGDIDVKQLFGGDSLLDKYFCEVINCKIR